MSGRRGKRQLLALERGDELMNLKNFMVLVLAGLLVISPVLAGGCVQTQTIKDVSPKEASTLIQNDQNNPDFVILDVRTRQEFTDGHIANAINIDFYADTFRDELNNLDKNKTYLIYCRSGGCSGKALNIMAELNFSKVYNISGGIIGWKAEGLPLVK